MKITSYSLGRPLDGHYPSIGRERRGTGAIRGGSMQYGTTLSCSCGWRYTGRINEAPTTGGRVSANSHYGLHVHDVLGAEPPTWTTVNPRPWGDDPASTYWSRWVADHGINNDKKES